MSRGQRLLGIALALFAVGVPARADGVRPVQVRIVEREPGTWLVHVRAPKVLAPQALPALVLPDDCRAEGERILVEQPDGWLLRQVYRSSEGLAGRTVGIRYPVYNPSLTTIFQVELLSGERFARALAPQEDSWRVPEADVGAFAGWLSDARAGTLRGFRHVLANALHVAFALVLAVLGGAAGSLGLVTAFAGGQLAALAAAALLESPVPPALAEAGLAVAVVLLAREALRPAPERRRPVGLAAAAGLVHGLALAALMPAESQGAAVSALVVLVLGMDAALLLLALSFAGLGRLVAARPRLARLGPAVAYAAGGFAAAAVLILTVGPAATPAAAARSEVNRSGASARLSSPAATSAAGLPGSRRVAPTATDAPIQSFLAIEPFEVRHEVLVRLADVASEVELADGADVEVAVQADLTRRVADLVLARTAVEIDGRPVQGILDRASFVTVDATGVLPRMEAVPEVVAAARIGVTVAYPTGGVPERVELAWDGIADGEAPIPATVTDPETSRTTTLTAASPALRWENELLEDPLPFAGDGVAVEARRLPLPLVSVALLVLAALSLVVGLRRRRMGPFVATRLALALALVLAPLAQVGVALPAAVAGSTSASQARRILAGLLPIVYRAFEVRDETRAYDQLAAAVTGDTLTDIYLEHRRSLEMEERGGARARVDAVEVVEVGTPAPHEGGGFEVDAAWTVGGTVTHFGHRHFRQNRYDARVAVVPVDGHWKVRSIEVLDMERVR